MNMLSVAGLSRTVGPIRTFRPSRTVGRAVLVDDATFDVPAGTLTALIGPNGAGKSTLLALLAGVQPPDHPHAARVSVGDVDHLALSRRERARQTAMLPQLASTEFSLTARQAVILGRIPHGSYFSPDRRAEAVVDEVMARVGITAWADRPLATLSGGEQQRVHLARALAQQPRLLLLDEPTNHLDIAAQLELFALLRELADDEGLTVVIALHDLAAAALHCDQAVVMDRGRAITAGKVSTALDPTLLHRIYGVRIDVLDHPRTGRPVVTFSRV